MNKTIILIQLKIFTKTVSPSDRSGHGRVLTAMSNVYPNPVVRGQGGGGGGGGSGLLPCPPLPPYSVAAPLYFPVPAVTYHGVQGALSVGKFPNPYNNVSQVISGRKKNRSLIPRNCSGLSKKSSSGSCSRKIQYFALVSYTVARQQVQIRCAVSVRVFQS